MAKPWGKMPASMIMTRIGGKDYPLKSVPTCKTCQSTHRLYIENALISGRTYRAIARSLPEDTSDTNPSADGIANHYNEGHMPINQAVQRRLIERRYEEIGQSMESEVDAQVDKVVVAQMIVQKGWELMQSGAVDPTVAETLAAIKALNEMEKDAEQSVDQETWVASMQVMMEIAHKLMTPVQWQEFGRLLSSNPILRALASKEDQTVEGELEE
jgi:hypothetical protein